MTLFLTCSQCALQSHYLKQRSKFVNGFRHLFRLCVVRTNTFIISICLLCFANLSTAKCTLRLFVLFFSCLIQYTIFNKQHTSFGWLYTYFMFTRRFLLLFLIFLFHPLLSFFLSFILFSNGTFTESFYPHCVRVPAFMLAKQTHVCFATLFNCCCCGCCRYFNSLKHNL